MPTVTISSLGNEQVKRVVKLNNRRSRKKYRQTTVEGLREITRALENEYWPQMVFVCPELLRDETAVSLARTLSQLKTTPPLKYYEVTTAVFQKMAYRGESGGILMVISIPEHDLADLQLGDSPFLAIIEGVEKPGNLGGILRTADAAGVDGVIVCGAQEQDATDLYNPNVVRASLGALFSVPVLSAENGRVHQWLTRNKIQMIATSPDADIPYTAVDMTGPTAILMGSEAHGLSQTWLQTAHQPVTIPMFGSIDSLNLSVATAILLYEVVRQRSTQHKPHSGR
jgi:TrmH family RNA methyltransferase